MFAGGEPGIGKSRLLSEFAARARAAGWSVLSGRACDMEGMPPYLPFVEVIREGVRESTDEALAELAAGASALCLLLPEVCARVPVQAPPPSAGPEGDRFRLFEAVARFLTTMARERESGGLLVLLDDLHWADRTTLLLLQHLTRKLAGTPLFIAGAYRTTDIDQGHPLHGVIADLTRERLCEQILLPPLSAVETRELAEGVAGGAASPEFAWSLHQETKGNPFFIEEVLRHLLERGADLRDDALAAGEAIPDSVRQVIRQRLAHLGAATNATLRAAAILGDAFDFGLLSATSELDPQPLADAVEEAARAGMVRPEGESYAFGHCLIRRTIYDDLSVPRRRQLHLRAAEAMEVSGYSPVAAGPAAIGNHWRLGGRPERGIDPLLRAGDAAIGLTAWEEAIRHWEAALECMEQAGTPPARRARLLEGLGDLDFLSSFEAHPAVERYLRASALYESAGDVLGAGRAKSRAGRSLAYPTSGFDYPGALDHLRAAEKVLAAGPSSVELGELYAALAHAESHALRNGPDQMIEAMRLLEEISGKLDSEFLQDLLRVQSYHLRGHYLGLQGHLADGLALEELACQTATALQDKGGTVNEWSGRWHEFLLAYSSEDGGSTANDAGSFQFSRVHSRAGLSNFTTNCCGWQLLDLHDPVGARAKHERIRDAQGRFVTPFLLYDLFLCGDIGTLRQLAEGGTATLSTINPETQISARLLLGWAEGRWAETESGYAERLQRWGQQGARGLAAWTGHPLLQLARINGDVASAEASALESLEISLGAGAVKYEFYARAELALLLAETGRLGEAERHLIRCREILAAGEDWRGLGGRELLAEAVYAAASGRHDEAEAQFGRALDVFRGLCLPWDEAETYEVWARAWGRVLRGRVRRAFIREKLALARAVYERIGAGQPWLDRLAARERGLVGVALEGAAPDL
ncbi:MAG: hypothetical protein C0506_15335, partial [Anaerolinea sp.]|nr:hypothetical protein [Anaerolinea sp.]